jgi:hypothetical protein
LTRYSVIIGEMAWAAADNGWATDAQSKTAATPDQQRA